PPRAPAPGRALCPDVPTRAASPGARGRRRGAGGGEPVMRAHFDNDQDEVLGKAYDGRLVRQLVPFIKPYWRSMLLALVFLLATSVLDLAGPFLTKIAIDRYIVPDKPAGLKLILVLYLGALVFGFAFRYLQNWFLPYV